MVDFKDIIDAAISKPQIVTPRTYSLGVESEKVRYIGEQLCAFTIDQDNQLVIEKLIQYFMGSMDKGILLRGGIGTGKTLLMTIFKHYASLYGRGFRIFHVRDIITDYMNSGAKGLSQYILPEVVECGQVTKKAFPICIDDIGTEANTYKFYGSQSNLIEELIYGRYDIWVSRRVVTHFTTNKTPKELKDFYGERAYSRIIEMMNDFILTGKDRRK